MFPDLWLLCFQPEHLPGLPHPSAKGTLLLFTLIRSNSCLHLLVCAGSPSTTPESMETPVSLFSTSWPWYYKTILCLYTLPIPDCLCVSSTFISHPLFENKPTQNGLSSVKMWTELYNTHLSWQLQTFPTFFLGELSSCRIRDDTHFSNSVCQAFAVTKANIQTFFGYSPMHIRWPVKTSVLKIHCDCNKAILSSMS